MKQKQNDQQYAKRITERTGDRKLQEKQNQGEVETEKINERNRDKEEDRNRLGKTERTQEVVDNSRSHNCLGCRVSIVPQLLTVLRSAAPSLVLLMLVLLVLILVLLLVLMLIVSVFCCSQCSL